MNDLNHKISKIQLLTAFLLLVCFGAIFAIMSQCGSSKKTIEVQTKQPEPIPEVLCDESEPLGQFRTQQCPAGQKGQITEVCVKPGKWEIASNSCVAECSSSSVVAFEPDIKAIIETHCTECHGGFNKYETAKNLATTPYGAAGGKSELLYYLSEAAGALRMPLNRTPLSTDEIGAIEAWINAGSPEVGDCPEEQAFIDQDYIESKQLELLGTIPTSKERQNRRFFTFAHKYNLGEDVNPHYKALNRAINSLSFENDVYPCTAIDKKKAVCAIDITELGLTQFDFLLIEKADEIKFISNTTKGQIIRELTGTNQPTFHFDVFIDTVFSNADLYYKLMGFHEFRQVLTKFGINFDQKIADREYRLIGTNESDISAARNTRQIIIMEGEINGFETFCHITHDNPAVVGAEFDLFQSPFLDGSGSENIFNFTASEAICGLVNRMHAYILSNNQGVLQAFAPENIVFCSRENCIDPTINNPIDCMNCHVDGYIPKIDVIRDHILTSGLFNAADVDLAKQVYLEASGNSALFNSHNATYHEAMVQIGRTEGEPNHLIDGQNTYLRSQTIEQVAAFFHTSPAYLKECITGNADIKEIIGPLINGDKVNHDVLVEAVPLVINDCDVLEDPIRPIRLQ